MRKQDKEAYDVNDTAGGPFADNYAARILIPRIQELLYSFWKVYYPTKAHYIVSKQIIGISYL